MRKEVVFLPCKASMWDSLESVWKAADEDPGCDAYVIPIPYYDKNPDGSWKKIILYDTSVNALLKHDEKMLVKIQDVFRAFKENQDEVALLWSPHLLIQATIESMRPQLWAAYRKLRKQYRAEGWGIYDDSSDMDRAVVVSDGYYGDPSSVVQLCQKVGKSVMMQNVDILEY